MKWSVLRPTILGVFSDISGIDTYWRDRERTFVRPSFGAICLLHTIASSSVGEDEFREVLNVAAQNLNITQAGIRNFTISVLVQSYDQDDIRIALEYLENIRDALQRPKIKDRFRAVNLSIPNIGGTVDLSDFEDDHMVSSASLDVFFAYGNNRTFPDAGLEPIDFIEQVGGEGTTVGHVTPITSDLS